VLRTRVLTALIILPATLVVVFVLPPAYFRLAIAALMLIGAWEFRRLADLGAPVGGLLFVLQAAVLGVLLSFWPAVAVDGVAILAVCCLLWLVMFTRLKGYSNSKQPDRPFRIASFFSALIALSACWFALAWLRDQPDGEFIIFLLFLVIWASDTGAYFSGKQFGRHKLARRISPNKTWEGVYGGIVLALAAAFLWSGLLAGLDIPATTLVAMTVITTFASIGGDLFVSVHKRTVGVDDAGTLFPGHGGVLDRYDSLMSGAPFFALALGWLGR
jgi:phosphatidate cytidylyltransferase